MTRATKGFSTEELCNYVNRLERSLWRQDKFGSRQGQNQRLVTNKEATARVQAEDIEAQLRQKQ